MLFLTNLEIQQVILLIVNQSHVGLLDQIFITTSGTKVIKFQLNSEGWLDPGTVVINFNLVNNDADVAKIVRPLQGAHSFIRRCRISANGALVKDFDYF